jgi:hypothetical protein
MWGAPRIHGELLKLGIDIGESRVTKYMLRCRKRRVGPGNFTPSLSQIRT